MLLTPMPCTGRVANQALATAGQCRVAKVTAVPKVGPDIEIRAPAQFEASIADAGKLTGGFPDAQGICLGARGSRPRRAGKAIAAVYDEVPPRNLIFCS